MSNYYFSNVQITLRSAVLAGWIIDRQANAIARRIVSALTSERAIGYYINAIDTFIWLCEVAYVSGQIARLLVAIAATWIDETVLEAQQSVVPDVDIDIEQVLADHDAYYGPIDRNELPTMTEAEAIDICQRIAASIPDREEIVSAPIDWKLWTADDLKKASQRSPFNIPLRVDGKVASKKLLVDMYTVAMAVDADSSFIWSEADAA